MFAFSSLSDADAGGLPAPSGRVVLGWINRPDEGVSLCDGRSLGRSECRDTAASGSGRTHGESGVAGVGRVMATATCTAFRGVLESTGERVGQRVLLERVGFLAHLSRELTGVLVASRWDEGSLDVLAAGVDGRGDD